MHSRGHQLTAGLMALALLTSGCYGPFNLTRRLYQWNGQVSSDRWAKEIAFLLLAGFQVYSLSSMGDAIIFNSMEFWTGKNPVDPPGKHAALPQTRRIARGHDEALLTYTPIAGGAELLVQNFRDGQPTGALRMQQQDGLAVGTDADGRVLVTAQALADGGVLVRDGQGKQLASYSADDVERFRHSTPR